MDEKAPAGLREGINDCSAGHRLLFLPAPRRSIPRVHAWPKSLFIRDASQQVRQQTAFLDGQCCAQSILVLARDLAYPTQHLFALRRQVYFRDAPVAVPGAPLHQACILHLVQYHHESAGKHTERRRQLLLTHVTVLADNPQNPGMRRPQGQRLQPPGKRDGRMSPYLCKEERRPAPFSS